MRGSEATGVDQVFKNKGNLRSSIIWDCVEVTVCLPRRIVGKMGFDES